MTRSFVTVPPDSTGKKLATSQVTDESANVVQRQEIIICDPETAANRLQVFAEDAAHTTGDKGLLMLVVQHAAESAMAGSDGDYAALLTDALGRLKVNSKPMTPTQAFVDSAASNNATALKASAGTVFGVQAYNANASARYLKLYNKATAPTVGTDVPVMVIAIPATSSVSLNFGELGMLFGTGIGYGIVTGAADSDNTSVAAHDIKVAISYV